jgi:hypothetical protein
LTDETSLILLHIAFLAFDTFYQTHSTPPGLYNVEEDAVEMTSTSVSITKELLSLAGSTIESEEYEEVRETLSSICTEM